MANELMNSFKSNPSFMKMSNRISSLEGALSDIISEKKKMEKSKKKMINGESHMMFLEGKIGELDDKIKEIIKLLRKSNSNQSFKYIVPSPS